MTKSIREVKQLTGVGLVFDDTEELGSVRYDLHFFQEFIHDRGGEIPGVGSARGFIEPLGSLTIHRLFGVDQLTLEIEDGRRLDFFTTDYNGSIQPTGALYRNSN